MSDETYSAENSSEINFTANVLELYRIFLILRNLSYNLNTEIQFDGINSSELFKEFEQTASRISDFTLFYKPESNLKDSVERLYFEIKEIINPYNSIFNTSVFNHYDDFDIIWRVTNEIKEIYLSNKSNYSKSTESTNYFFKTKPQFESIKATYDSFLDTIKVKDELNRISSDLTNVLNKSTELDKLIDDFEKSHISFKVFEEKQFNDETKKIYDNIYIAEYRLANAFRDYAICSFIIIAGIACFNFLLPTLEGIINFFKIGKFQTTPVDIYFFVKTIFLLLLTAPGWYFTRESSKHRQVAYKAKIISSELSALPYYLADLNEKDRHEMRMKMADKFFGQELYNDKKSDSSNVSEQTKATTEAIKTINALISKPNKPTDNGHN